MKLNIRDHVLYEGILTTSCSGEIYISPVGFRKEKDIVEIKVYKGGSLERAVLERDEIILNITHDPLVFVDTAFKNKIVTSRLIREYVVFNEDGVVLREGIGYILLEKNKIIDTGDYYIVRYKVKKIVTRDDQQIEPYSRCYGSILEIAIYVSKINALKHDTKLVLDYLSRINIMLEVINKTCSKEYIESTYRLLEVLPRNET